MRWCIKVSETINIINFSMKPTDQEANCFRNEGNIKLWRCHCIFVFNTNVHVHDFFAYTTKKHFDKIESFF